MIVAGMEVRDIDERYTPLGLCMVMTVLDEDGDVSYVVRYANMDALQRLGALRLLNILEEDSVIKMFQGDED